MEEAPPENPDSGQNGLVNIDSVFSFDESLGFSLRDSQIRREVVSLI